MQRVAVLTSGGDAPGMNAAIRAVVRTALGIGAEVFGVYRGYEGLLAGDIRPLSSTDVGGIIGRGGTILRSARSEEFRQSEGRAIGASHLRKQGIEKLIVIGGDGSLMGGLLLSKEQGIHVVGIPGSIDNDIPCSDLSIGFDTAINTALEVVDKLRDTAYSHERVFVVEVMGRKNGFIALEVGLAGGAEAILIPEIPYSLQEVVDQLKAGHSRGKRSSIIVLAEGAGKAEDVQRYLIEATGYEVRYLVLGHMQRGGSPTSVDRVLATRLGAEAAKRILREENAIMVGLEGTKIVATDLVKVFETERKVDSERLLLAEVMAQ